MRRLVYCFFILFPFICFSQSGITVKQLKKSKSCPAEFKEYKTEAFFKTFNEDKGNNSIENILSSHKSLKEEEAWLIVSMKSDNQTYENPSSNVKADIILDFREVVCVIDVKDNWFQVKRLTKPSGKWKLSKTYGWIHAKNTIYSNCAPLQQAVERDPITGNINFDKIKGSSPKKALIITNIDNILSNPEEFENAIKEKSFYYDPNLNTPIPGAKVPPFKIYYVIDQQGSNSLLATTDVNYASPYERNGKFYTNKISGWMSNNFITNWDHRICLEIAHGSRAANAYHGKKIPVFFDLYELQNYQQTSGQGTGRRVREFKIHLDRPWGGKYRMPILKKTSSEEMNTDQTQKKVACIGSARGNVLDDTTIEQIDKYREDVAKLTYQMNNVNILFVVDATRSMANYKQKIINAIDTVILNNNWENVENLNFAIGIYRGINDGHKYKKFDFYELTSSDNIENLRKFYKTLIFDSESSIIAEAHYYGLYYSMDKCFKGTEGESNIVVLVGDVGDQKNPSGKNQEDVEKLLAEHNVNLISYQVNSKDGGPHYRFLKSSRSYIEAIAYHYDKNAEMIWEDVYDEVNDFNYYNYETTGLLPPFAQYRSASNNRPMLPSIFHESVVSSIDAFLNKLNSEIIRLQNLVEGVGQDDDEKISICADLIKRIPGWTEKDCKKLLEFGTISKAGWVLKEYYNEEVSAFTNVVFMSRAFKTKVFDVRLENLFDCASGSERKCLYDAICGLAKALLGDDIDDERIDQLTLNQVWQIIFQIKSSSKNPIFNLSIENIQLDTQDGLSDRNFNNFYEKFKREAQHYRMKSYTDDKSVWNQGNEPFLWIPLGDIPGCDDE